MPLFFGCGANSKGSVVNGHSVDVQSRTLIEPEGETNHSSAVIFTDDIRKSRLFIEINLLYTNIIKGIRGKTL